MAASSAAAAPGRPRRASAEGSPVEMVAGIVLILLSAAFIVFVIRVVQANSRV